MVLTKNLNEDLSVILTHGQCVQIKVYFLQFKPETGDTLNISNQEADTEGGSAGGYGRGLTGRYRRGVRRLI